MDCQTFLKEKFDKDVLISHVGWNSTQCQIFHDMRAKYYLIFDGAEIRSWLIHMYQTIFLKDLYKDTPPFSFMDNNVSLYYSKKSGISAQSTLNDLSNVLQTFDMTDFEEFESSNYPRLCMYHNITGVIVKFFDPKDLKRIGASRKLFAYDVVYTDKFCLLPLNGQGHVRELSGSIQDLIDLLTIDIPCDNQSTLPDYQTTIQKLRILLCKGYQYTPTLPSLYKSLHCLNFKSYSREQVLDGVDKLLDDLDDINDEYRYLMTVVDDRSHNKQIYHVFELSLHWINEHGTINDDFDDFPLKGLMICGIFIKLTQTTYNNNGYRVDESFVDKDISMDFDILPYIFPSELNNHNTEELSHYFSRHITTLEPYDVSLQTIVPEPLTNSLHDCVDIMLINTHQIQDWLNANPQHIIFYRDIPNQNGPNIIKSFCYDITTIQSFVEDFSYIYYPCQNVEDGYKTAQLTFPIMKIPLDYQLYVPRKDVEQWILNDHHQYRIFKIVDSEHTFPLTFSANALIYRNYVSADHCQSNTSKTVSRLIPTYIEDVIRSN